MTKQRGTKDVLVRFPPDVYDAVKSAATLAGVSMNTLIVDTARSTFDRSNYAPGASPVDVLNSSRAFYSATVASSTPPDTQISASLTSAINALAGEPPTTKEDHT